MPASSALSIPGPLQSVMIAAAVFAACVAGVVVFLGWLDKQVPSLPVGQLAIGLAGLRGGIIGVYGDLFVNIWHRLRGFAAFGIIDGAVTSGVGQALAIYETGTLGKNDHLL